MMMSCIISGRTVHLQNVERNKVKKKIRWINRYSKLISLRNTMAEMTLRKQQTSTKHQSHLKCEGY